MKKTSIKRSEIIFPLAALILFYTIIFFLLKNKFSYEEKVIFSITLFLIMIFDYLRIFSKRFRNFLETKTVKVIRKLGMIIGFLFAILISCLSIRAYLSTSSIIYIFISIFFIFGSILILWEILQTQKPYK